MSAEEIADYIGAESVMFLPMDELKNCLNISNDYCYSCFCGDYPVESLKDEALKKES
jgi:amidophosphoribosyltransferase